MLQVSLTGSLRSAANDVAVVEIDAGTIRELLTKLVERYPRMNKHVDEGIAVSIDGEIYRDNWSTMIPADSEVFLLPRIPGG
ncbi:MAG: MoaD/ThiS family protein [Gammaproteobacteria bacterium]|nr:MoaD/ThiS family protein [Gammaproteobacteria bacterium]